MHPLWIHDATDDAAVALPIFIIFIFQNQEDYVHAYHRTRGQKALP